MTDNHSYIADDEITIPIRPRVGSTTAITIEDDGTQTVESSYADVCCSWSRMCDVLGNRQGSFIMALRPVKGYLIRAQQQLRRFQMELERGIKTRNTARTTASAVKVSVVEINKLTTHVDLNIPPEEGEMLRCVSYDLTVLARVIEAVMESTPAIPHVPSGRNLRDVGVVRKDSSGTEIRDMATGSSPAAVDEHSLKERIGRNCEMIEKLIKFIDKKTERRWWLRDVINFLQLFIKLALFISAACSVAYHQEQIAPIITLTIAIVQGIVEMLDQYFLKHTKPEEIKLSVVSTLTAIDSRT